MKSKFRKVKIIAVAFICILTFSIVSMPIRASAYDINEIERSLSTIEPRAQYYFGWSDVVDILNILKGGLDGLTEPDGALSQIVSLLQSLIDPQDNTIVTTFFSDWTATMTASIADMFALVETQLEGGVDANILDNSAYSSDINSILGYVSVTAATFSSIFWGIGQVKNAIHYEEWTEKKVAIAIGTVIISASLIRNSARVCLWIYKQEAGLVGNVLGTSSIKDTITGIMFNSDWLYNGSELPIIGVIIDFILSGFIIIPFGLCVIFLLIMACLVYIKLILRELEIATMACVSPIFFGCWVSETTRPYLKNFIATFLSVVFETLFMGITLRLGAGLLGTAASGGGLEMIKAMQVFVMAGAIMVMCFKPPQILSNLVRA